MTPDLLTDVPWECCSAPPNAAIQPRDLDLLVADWIPIHVPGTVGGALRASGRPWEEVDLDATDWWFRCRFGGPPGDVRDWILCCDGLATIATVWVNGVPVLQSESMFIPAIAVVPRLDHENEIVIRCAALSPWLATRRPRGRWRSRLVTQQNLRWVRTALLGRTTEWAGRTATVGPWRPIRLLDPRSLPIVAHRMTSAVTADGTGGVVSVELETPGEVHDATLRVAGQEERLGFDGRRWRGALRLDGIERWWPHTHGPQHRYPVTVDLDGHQSDLGRIGFRTVDADRSDGGFALRVNGAALFCRGACWFPPDPVSLAADPYPTLELARNAGMNMIRIPGTTVYADANLWNACDELGILVWQDCMFANLDPPEDDAFKALVHAEVTAMIGDAAGHPSLAVVCGGSEVEQQAAMQGLGPDRYVMPLFSDDISALVAAVAPGVPYVTSSPTGGDPPFRVDTGIAHYFGVGAYRRPLDDARRAGVRFASECLAIAIPPERATVERHFGGADAAGHDPRWKAAVPRDNGTSWDFEDVRDHYVRSLFGDAAAADLRVTDPERALDLGRATASEVMSVAMSEWRRPGSPCAGAVVLALRDQKPGAGWGLIDSDGIPKAPWWALRRIQQPLALLMSDEGLNGLDVHVINDGAHVIAGRLQVQLFNSAAVVVEEREIEVVLAPRSARSFNVEELIGGFRDVTWAYRFGPPGQDVTAATFIGQRDGEWCQAVHLPGGYARPVEVDLGLTAEALVEDGRWLLEIGTRRFAQWVVIDVPGYRPGDSWFHLLPGAVRRLSLEPLVASPALPNGELRALNCETPVRIAVRQ